MTSPTPGEPLDLEGIKPLTAEELRDWKAQFPTVTYISREAKPTGMVNAHDFRRALVTIQSLETRLAAAEGALAKIGIHIGERAFLELLDNTAGIFAREQFIRADKAEKALTEASVREAAIIRAAEALIAEIDYDDHCYAIQDFRKVAALRPKAGVG